MKRVVVRSSLCQVLPLAFFAPAVLLRYDTTRPLSEFYMLDPDSSPGIDAQDIGPLNFRGTDDSPSRFLRMPTAGLPLLDIRRTLRA